MGKYIRGTEGSLTCLNGRSEEEGWGGGVGERREEKGYERKVLEKYGQAGKIIDGLRLNISKNLIS